LLNSTSLWCKLSSSFKTKDANFLLSRPGPSHIVPVLVGDASLAKAASDKLLAEHNIYVQSINYPTVARGEERLRITVTPRHTLEQMDKLVLAIDQIFTELDINRLQDWKRVGGRAGVGMTDGPQEAHVDPMWTDAQLGLLDGTTPRTLRNGKKAVVDGHAAGKARAVFDPLLGSISGPLQATRTVQLENQVASAPLKKRQKLPVMKAGGGVPLNGDIPLPPPSIAVSA